MYHSNPYFPRKQVNRFLIISICKSLHKHIQSFLHISLGCATYIEKSLFSRGKTRRKESRDRKVRCQQTKETVVTGDSRKQTRQQQ